jgi:excinuclease ABC subunit A
MVVVSGVSGSGKSSLINDILSKELLARLHRANTVPGRHDDIEGIKQLDKAIIIDQSPIGRTPRSNPATYTGLFTPIRELFAATPEAKLRGYSPGRFSFNVKGGPLRKLRRRRYYKNRNALFAGRLCAVRSLPWQTVQP